MKNEGFPQDKFLKESPFKDGEEAKDQLVETREYIASTLHVDLDAVSDDAVHQLLDAFMPAIGIMVERGNLRGELWRQSGWAGALYEARKKLERLWRSWWVTRHCTDGDSALDLLNFTGFFIRAADNTQMGSPWGEYGEPGIGAE